MNEGESCENCRYFLITDPDKNLNRERVCRRYPPTVFVMAQGGQVISRSFFPAVVERMWCGEWASNEGAAETKQ